jgi:hypothetical protein
VELHPLHADVAAYYADYAGASPVLTQMQATQQQHGERSIYPKHTKNQIGSCLGWHAAFAIQLPVVAKVTCSSSCLFVAAVVEVHLEVHYKACFGSQLAVVGSHTGWLTSAAVPMTCGGAEADTWSVVLSLPYG